MRTSQGHWLVVGHQVIDDVMKDQEVLTELSVIYLFEEQLLRQ